MRPVEVTYEDSFIAALGSGVKDGERVVIDGQLRLTPGIRFPSLGRRARSSPPKIRLSVTFRAPTARKLLPPPRNAETRASHGAASREKNPDAFLRCFHQASGDDELADGGVRDRRAVRLFLASRQRASQRRFPDHRGERQLAGRRCRNHGVVRGHAAGEAVLADRRPRFDELANALGTQTQITLQFRLDRNIDAAFQDVQAAASAATRALPRDMPSPPSLRKINPAEGSILLAHRHLADAAALASSIEYVEDR